MSYQSENNKISKIKYELNDLNSRLKRLDFKVHKSDEGINTAIKKIIYFESYWNRMELSI